MIYIRILFSLFILITSQIDAMERLLLHFDVNNTLIAVDKLEGKTSTNVINHHLSKKYIGIWDEQQNKPLSYYDYVHQILIPGDPKDQELKRIRRDYLNHFVEFLDETNHPLSEKVKLEFQAILHKLEDSKSFVFESFYTLLNHLELEGVDYSIILRSFGHDLNEVAHEIEKNLNRSCFDQFVSFKQGILHVGHHRIEKGLDIYHFLNSGKNIVIQDDWLWWHRHGENSNFGKPFYVHNNDVLEIFFDDNVKPPSSSTNIVAPIDAMTEAPLSIKDLIETGQIVYVDTLEAIMDDQYFIKKIKSARSYLLSNK